MALETNNVMRRKQRALTDREKEQIQQIKDMGTIFHDYLTSLAPVCGDSRELAIAKTKLEESVMWAVKHVSG